MSSGCGPRGTTPLSAGLPCEGVFLVSDQLLVQRIFNDPVQLWSARDG